MIGSWKRAAAVSAVCVGLAAAATAGVAQDRPGGGPQGFGRHSDADRQKMFEEIRVRREKMMHDVLQIKPDQEPAFHAFTASMTPPPREGRDGPGGPGDRGPNGAGPNAAPMTVPERLDRMNARMAERQARFQKTAAATKTFYAVLTPDQRRAFDAMPMMMGGGRHGRMGGGHHFEGPL